MQIPATKHGFLRGVSAYERKNHGWPYPLLVDLPIPQCDPPQWVYDIPPKWLLWWINNTSWGRGHHAFPARSGPGILGVPLFQDKAKWIASFFKTFPCHQYIHIISYIYILYNFDINTYIGSYLTERITCRLPKFLSIKNHAKLRYLDENRNTTKTPISSLEFMDDEYWPLTFRATIFLPSNSTKRHISNLPIFGSNRSTTMTTSFSSWWVGVVDRVLEQNLLSYRFEHWQEIPILKSEIETAHLYDCWEKTVVSADVSLNQQNNQQNPKSS